MGMRKTLTSWSLPQCSLAEAAAIAGAIGMDAIDVGYFYRGALDKGRLLADPEQVAGEVAGLGIGLASMYHLFGDSLSDRNLADPGSLKANVADFRQVARFCKAAGIPSLFILPGVVNPGQGRDEAMAASAAALGEMVAIGNDAGVVVTTEPHVHSYLESPSLTERLLDMVPGLRLTLDYAHFVCLGFRQEEIDPLAPHAAHVHMRQAKPGALQCKTEMGTINIEAQLACLRDAGYEGYLALEYVHQEYMGTLHDDVLTETIKLRDTIDGWQG